MILKRSNIPPTIAPSKAAKKKVNKVFCHPHIIPMIPRSFISPAPIPPLLTKIMIAIKRNPTTPPMIASYHGVNGEMIRATIISGKKNSKILFGINI